MHYIVLTILLGNPSYGIVPEYHSETFTSMIACEARLKTAVRDLNHRIHVGKEMMVVDRHLIKKQILSAECKRV